MIILDGKKTSNDIKDEIAKEVDVLLLNGGKKPHLAAILVGDNGASETYVSAKVKACNRVGFNSTLIRLPENVSEKQLIEEIWRWNSPWDFPRYNPLYLSGVEYWTGVYGPDKPNKNLGNHYDKDELHFKRTGEVVKPLMGTVYYPKEMDIDGGYLEIYTDGTDSEPERIKPIYNRLIIFEAGEYVHTVTPVTRGTRYAIAVNLWSEPPVGVYEKAFTIE